jgi:hypothetical protein
MYVTRKNILWKHEVYLKYHHNKKYRLVGCLLLSHGVHPTSWDDEDQ